MSKLAWHHRLEAVKNRVGRGAYEWLSRETPGPVWEDVFKTIRGPLEVLVVRPAVVVADQVRREIRG